MAALLGGIAAGLAESGLGAAVAGGAASGLVEGLINEATDGEGDGLGFGIFDGDGNPFKRKKPNTSPTPTFGKSTSACGPSKKYTCEEKCAYWAAMKERCKGCRKPRKKSCTKRKTKRKSGCGCGCTKSKRKTKRTGKNKSFVGSKTYEEFAKKYKAFNPSTDSYELNADGTDPGYEEFMKWGGLSNIKSPSKTQYASSYDQAKEEFNGGKVDRGRPGTVKSRRNDRQTNRKRRRATRRS